jgi:hypothetical protein
VAPGETRKILVKMNTHAYTSDIHKEIKVETNDPNASLITLIVKGKAFETLKVSPRIINFGRMQQNQTATKEVLVENASKKPFKVTKITTASANPSLLTVTPGEPFTLKPGESRKLEVKISTGTAVGYLDDSVTLETDIPYLQQKKVYMHVEVRD